MKQGTRVITLDWKQRELEQVVWRDTGRGVLLCTQDAYIRAVSAGTEPVTVGFPREDVRITEASEEEL